MRPLTYLRDQDVSSSLGTESVDLREFTSAGALCAAWARRLLHAGNFTPRERQNLHDITRVVRMTAADRSAFGLLVRYAPRAGHTADAFAGLELARAGIVAQLDVSGPDEDSANVCEESTNRDGNIAQIRHQARRSRSTLEELVFRMSAQSIASRQLADVSVARMSRR